MDKKQMRKKHDQRKRVLLITLLFSICTFVGVHLAITYAKAPVSAATSGSHQIKPPNTKNDISKNIKTTKPSIKPSIKPSTNDKPSTSTQNTYTGLRRIDGKAYYFENGQKFCNGLKTVKVNGRKYFFYFTENGQAFTDGFKEVKIGDKKHYYYFKKNGHALTDKLKSVSINDEKYYYYFNKSGRALTKKWKTIDDKKYFFGKDGRAYTGTRTVSHYLCHFTDKGVMYRIIDKNKKMIALTYDDGPSIYTPKILSTLKENNAVATFFVVGSRVSTYSDTLKKEYKLHCQIGNHSYNHPILTKVGAETIINEMNKTNEAIRKVIGQDPIIMRPPGGATNNTVKENVNFPMIIWSVDTLDWKTRNVESTKNAVLGRVKDGDIVLMHDLYDATATASQTIIPQLISDGYHHIHHLNKIQ